MANTPISSLPVATSLSGSDVVPWVVSGTTSRLTWTVIQGLIATAVAQAGIAQNSQSADYTLVLADGGKHILHPASDANSRTFTIPANASVAYPTGTVITFVNLSANALTIAITSDTLTFAGSGSTGSRSLADNGIATALKVGSTEWLISGTNLS